MVALLGPILAQLVTLSLFDRTEAREILNGDNHVEASTVPVASLGMRWKHSALSVSYSPLLTVSPLQSDSRRLLLYQSASVVGSYTLGRTVVFAAESAGYGELNFQQQALAGGATLGGLGAPPSAPVPSANGGSAPIAIGTVISGPAAGGTTGVNGTTNGSTTPTQNQLRAENQVVRFAALTSTAGINHAASARLAYGGDAAYTVTEGLGTDQAQYPRIEGMRWSLFTRNGWDHHDDATSAVGLQYSTASTGTSAWLGTFTENWTHRFGPHTATALGVGVSGTRTPVQNDGSVVAYSVYPTVNASIVGSTLLERGTLTLSLFASSAPALDLITLAVDPRTTFGVTAGYSRDRFYSACAVASALSVASNSQNTGALSSVSGSLTAGYVLGRAVSVDAGVRGAYQTYQGATIIPFTYAGFVGVNFGAVLPLR